MGAIEIIINGLVADISVKTSIRLNRVFIDPTQFNLKDAVYTFNVILPLTARNSAIFNRADIEEAQGKFTQNVAQINANGLQIFDGICRVTSIESEISCNFYRPAVRELADVFADKFLNQNPPLWLDFGTFPASVSTYNDLAKTTPQKAVFPFIFWGVIPKIPSIAGTEAYTPANVWDNTARLGIQDVPPAFNLIEIITHLFEANGLNLRGNALSNKVLQAVYFSYKNPVDYVQPWNFGELGQMKIIGKWGSYQNQRTEEYAEYEQGVTQSDDGGNSLYSTNMLDCTNSEINILTDKGGNITYSEREGTEGKTWVNCQVNIPVSGFYKVQIKASIRVDNTENFRVTDPLTNIQHLGGLSDLETNSFEDNIYEIKLLRDRKNANFGLDNSRFDGTLYRENLPQNEIFDNDNIPKYFPQVLADGQTNLVDIKENSNLITGFSFGSQADKTYMRNPKDATGVDAKILAGKSALSWSIAENSDYSNALAIKSAGYWKYGRIGNFDTEGENPPENLDYSTATKVLGRELDTQGNPKIPAPTGSLTNRLTGFYIDDVTGYLVEDTDWSVSDMLSLTVYPALTFSGSVLAVNPLACVYAFYDASFFFIEAFSVSSDTVFTDAPVVFPTGAEYIRFSEYVGHELTIEAQTFYADNIILHRFPLPKFYTYTVTLPLGVTEPVTVFVHEGTEVKYTLAVETVGGIAVIDITGISEPHLTMYLKTNQFDFDGTMAITREISASSAKVVGWELSEEFKIDLINAPANYAKRGVKNGVSAPYDWNAEGKSSVVVWLEQNEMLSIASVSSEGGYRRSGMHTAFGWVIQYIDFELEITPFRTEKEWLKIDARGNGTAVMDWNDAVNFETSRIDLVKFLASNIKTNDFVTNVCKAFNLRLTSDDGINYRLDTKYNKLIRSGSPVNLNNVAGLKRRKNEPLNLPNAYKVNFAINENEEGFVRTGLKGNGQVNTGGTSDAITQSSFFSYAWYKELQQGANVAQVPIISLAEFWGNSKPYKEAMLAKGYDLGMRFFFFADTLDEDGITFEFAGEEIKLARMANIAGVGVIDYGTAQDSLLRYFFYTDLRERGHYTYIYARLEPAQYKALSASATVGFNGDVYGLAGVTGYDPMGKNETELKLIKQ